MFENLLSLNDLSLGEKGKVKELKSKGKLRRRMLDLGFVPNTNVEALYQSPSGNPKAYFIKNTVIALRHEDSSKIFIETH